MKKERVWIAGVLLFFMTLILLTGFVQRIQYEQKSRYAFVSADMKNLKSIEKNTVEALTTLSDAGTQLVTVDAMTIKGLKAEGRLELISYSSLAINEDVISQQIRNALGDYQMKPENLIAIVTDTALGEFLRMELSYRYTDYTYRLLEDGQTMIFAFQSLTQENDLIAGYDYGDLDLIQRADMKAAVIYPSYSFENPVYPKYFKEFINSNGVSFVVLRHNPYDNKKPLSEEMKAVLRSTDFTLVVFENENQISNEKPYLYHDFFQVAKQNVIRGFHMDKILEYDQSLYRYRYYQWFNSALERNTVFIHTNILENPQVDQDTNFSLTAKAISDFTSSLKGYQFPDARENIPYSYPQNTMVMAGGILALSLIYLYLLFMSRKPISYLTEGYFVAMMVSVIASYAFASYLAAFFAWLVMVSAVSLITIVLFYQDDTLPPKKKLLWMLLSTFTILAVAIIAIAALLGGIEFYTSTALFYGVKLSLLIPVAVTIFNAYLIYYSKDLSLKEAPKAFWNWCKKLNRWILLPVGIAILLFLGYYLIRTGKSDLLLPMEDRFRKWLTDVFYIRPRFKEFLFGYPMFSLFVYCCVSKARLEWRLITGILSTILFTSILNTLCHTFTAVTLSLWRIANGLLCGIVISAVIIGIILLIRKVLIPKFFHKKA